MGVITRSASAFLLPLALAQRDDNRFDDDEWCRWRGLFYHPPSKPSPARRLSIFSRVVSGGCRVFRPDSMPLW